MDGLLPADPKIERKSVSCHKMFCTAVFFDVRLSVSGRPIKSGGSKDSTFLFLYTALNDPGLLGLLQDCLDCPVL